MTQPRTCQGWLIWLDQQNPTEEHWSDPNYLYLISQIMLLFIPRRMGQMLIDAGEVQDIRPQYRR